VRLPGLPLDAPVADTIFPNPSIIQGILRTINNDLSIQTSSRLKQIKDNPKID